MALARLAWRSDLVFSVPEIGRLVCVWRNEAEINIDTQAKTQAGHLAATPLLNNDLVGVSRLLELVYSPPLGR